MEAVVWFGVCQHVLDKMEQPVLIKIGLLRDVENVSQLLKYPPDDRRWAEMIYASRR